ncbi:MAG TPA: LD-carboxypeptidase [Bacteroidales bacterium]|nr:LD-carboxypeptidase [Bacteroidales bacterium]
MPVSKTLPPFLKKGDEVAIVSPAFCIDEDKLHAAVDFLADWGLKARIGKNAAKRNGPFAGTDEERLSDFQEATDDPSVKAVLCARGGYGLLRIIDRIDFSSLKKSPKWYVGYSDITVLHTWLSERENLVSIHGDMPLNYYDTDKEEITFSTLKKALFGRLAGIVWEGDGARKRRAEGEIAGGNLSLYYSLVGTPADPDTNGKILFLEDVGEYYYHIDRMLSSLKLAGKLDNLAALVVGGMTQMNDTRIPWGKSIEETILEIVAEYDYPVLFGFPAGHVNDNRAVFIGRNAVVEAKGKKSSLKFT